MKSAVLKIRLEVGRSFNQNRSIIADYHWIPHWKCTVKFVLPNWTLLHHMLKWVRK